MKKKIRLLLIIVTFTMAGCQSHGMEESTNEESAAVTGITTQSEPASAYREAESLQTELEMESETELPEFIRIDKEKRNKMPLGYTARIATAYEKYARDPEYTVPKNSVGKGIFVTEKICDADVVLTKILRDIINSRGEKAKEYTQYFSSDHILQNVQNFNWDGLGDNWMEEEFYLQRNYELFRIYGRSDYEFFYTVQADLQKMKCDESVYFEITVTVSEEDGKIYYLDIQTFPQTQQEFFVSNTNMWADNFTELLIQDGNEIERKIYLNFTEYYQRVYPGQKEYEQIYEGFFVDDNAAENANYIGMLLLDILNRETQDLSNHLKYFEEDSEGFQSLVNLDLKDLESNWKANEKYDCYYVDRIRELGIVQYDYYFYPDYEEMGAEIATAVCIEVYIYINHGKLLVSEIQPISLTKSDYERIRVRMQEKEDREYIVRHGEKQAELTDHLTMEKVVCFGEELSAAINEREDYYICETAKKGERHVNLLDSDDIRDETWKTTGDYDCYAIQGNAVKGYDHFRYYFHPEDKKTGKKNQMVMLDFYTKDGIIKRFEHSKVMDTVYE